MQSVLNKQQGTTFLLYLALVAKNIQGKQLQDIKISCLVWAQHAPATDFSSLAHRFFFPSSFPLSQSVSVQSLQDRSCFIMYEFWQDRLSWMR